MPEQPTAGGDRVAVAGWRQLGEWFLAYDAAATRKLRAILDGTDGHSAGSGAGRKSGNQEH